MNKESPEKASARKAGGPGFKSYLWQNFYDISIDKN